MREHTDLEVRQMILSEIDVGIDYFHNSTDRLRAFTSENVAEKLDAATVRRRE